MICSFIYLVLISSNRYQKTGSVRIVQGEGWVLLLHLLVPAKDGESKWERATWQE